jgi:inner membrane protein
MTPDLDLLIRSGTDPLLAIEFHRHFTHSLSFIPLGALLCSLALYPLFKSKLGFWSCYLFSLLGFASHGLLDACTAYGTRLLWPFSDARIAWDLVSVVDPLFTLPLLVFVVLAVVKCRPVLALVGVLWCIAYLGLGLIQNHRASAAVAELAAARGHTPAAIDVKPSLGNLLLWKSIYADDGRYFVDAVRVVIWPKVFEGDQRPMLNLARDFPWLEADSQQARDVERFRRFAAGYLAVAADDPNRIVDLRYSLVPNSAHAFWGIELKADAAPDEHAGYVTMRVRTVSEGKQLLTMLFR